jgi:hypothetical protein
MGLLSEYNLTDELTQDVLKELGFSESFAMSVNNDSQQYKNYFRARYYGICQLNKFGLSKSFYCSYRYFPELNYLMIRVEGFPSNYMICNVITVEPGEVSTTFEYTVKYYSDMVVYLSEEWLIENIKDLKFLK